MAITEAEKNLSGRESTIISAAAPAKSAAIAANRFHRERVKKHLKIGLEAIHILREAGTDQLHSRKLRSFDEPAFR